MTNVSVCSRAACSSGSASISDGAADITDDIASRLRHARAPGRSGPNASTARRTMSSARQSRDDRRGAADPDEGAEGARITARSSIAVIRQRLERLMGEIAKELQGARFRGPRSAARSCSTGGGAELKGVADYAQRRSAARCASAGRAGSDGAARGACRPGLRHTGGAGAFAAADPVDLRALDTGPPDGDQRPSRERWSSG